MFKLHLSENVWPQKCCCLFFAVIACTLSTSFGDKEPKAEVETGSKTKVSVSANLSNILSATKSPHTFSVFNSTSEDVLQFLLNTANSSSDQQDAEGDAEDNIEIDLDETRSELLRILQSRIRVEEDVKTHEKLKTISEAHFKTALDEVLKRQLNQARKNGLNAPSESVSLNQTTPNTTGVNPTNVPAPIDYSKPYMLKCDSRGSCYASPLSDDEVPPLPSYTDALECARQPTPTRHTKPNDDSNIV